MNGTIERIINTIDLITNVLSGKHHKTLDRQICLCAKNAHSSIQQQETSIVHDARYFAQPHIPSHV
jgi:hypothetical protein